MIDPATVKFTDGTVQQAERVNLKDGGWAGAYFDGAWHYYPPGEIACVRSRAGDESDE